MSNSITAFFKGRTGVAESVYQYDYGKVLIIDGLSLPATFEVHFTTVSEDDAITVIGQNSRVAIPDSCINKPGTVTAYIYLHTGENDGETEYVIKFAVIRRAKPDYDEDDKSDWESAASQALAMLQNSKKVNTPLDEYNQVDNGTAGQLLRTKGDGSTEWVDEGLPTDEQTAAAVSAWLDEHPEATTTVEDGSLTEAKLANALKLKVLKDYVTPEMFGAKNDGTTDDAQAIEDAVSYAVTNKVPLVFLDSGDGYLSSEPIVIEDSIDIMMYGALVYKGSGTALTVGKAGGQLVTSGSIYNVKSDSISTGSVGIKIINLINSNITIKDSAYFDTGVSLIGNGAAFAYNTINLGRIWKSNTGLDINCVGANGYINENLFIGGRIDAEDYAILIDGESHGANNNVFIKPCCEGADVAVKIDNGYYNTIYQIRSEGATKLFDGSANAGYNRIIVGYGETSYTSVTADNEIDVPRRLPILNHILFSGSIYDKCVGDSSWVFGEDLYQLRDNVYYEKCFSVYRNADNVNPASRPIGFRVKCNGGETFIISRCFAESTNGSVLLRFLDSGGSVITEAPKSIAGLTFVQTTLGGTDYYGTTDSEVDVMFSIPTNCKEVYIGFISGKLTAVSIISNGKPYILKHPLICESKPTTAAEVGTFAACNTPVASSISGWIYGEDSEWHAVSL